MDAAIIRDQTSGTLRSAAATFIAPLKSGHEPAFDF
jgi:hypothetical protein